MSVLKSLKGWKLVQSCGKDKKLLVDTGSEVIPLGEGGGSADLNANEGEAGYVKNRTHWTENGMVEVLPETTMAMVSINDQDDGFYNEVLLMEDLEAGKQYVVNWNGVSYKCVAYDVSGDICIGNQQVAIEVDGWEFNDVIESNAPFFIVGGFDKRASVLVPEDITCTFSIAHKAEIVHKIDPKYLPEGVGYETTKMVELVPETTMILNTPENESQPIFVTSMPAAGSTVKVVYDGVEYSVIAAGDDSSYVGFGNLAVWGDPPEISADVPFVVTIETTSDAGIYYCVLYDINCEGTHTFSISYEEKSIHKIDPKYLPERLIFTFEASGGYVMSNMTYNEVLELYNNGILPPVSLYTMQDGYYEFGTYNSHPYRMCFLVDDCIRLYVEIGGDEYCYTQRPESGYRLDIETIPK